MKEKNNNGILFLLMGVIIVILVVLCILFATGTITLKFNEVNDQSFNSNDKISYNIDDYISKEKVNIGNESFNIEKVSFKNLDSSLTQKFMEEQTRLIDSANNTYTYFKEYKNDELAGYYIEGTKYLAKTNIWYQINKNILTVYNELEETGEIGNTITTAIINIDLLNKKVLTNQELLESVNYSYKDIAEKEYNRVIESCTNQTNKNFCYYDRNEKEVTLEEHKNNKETFISNIENELDDLVKVYIQDGKVKYDFRPVTMRLVNEYLGIGGPFAIETVEIGEYK